MTVSFPYPILQKEQLIAQINSLAASHMPFLFVIDYKAEYGYVIKKEELDASFVRFAVDGLTPGNSVDSMITNAIEWDVHPVSIEK